VRSSWCVGAATRPGAVADAAGVIFPGAPISNPGLNMVNGKPMNHHRDQGSGSDTCHPASWNRTSYTPDFLAELGEPLPDKPNGYRQAAIYHLQLMFAVDEFLIAAQDARLAVAVVLGWPSTRGLSIGNIADQLGVSATTITRACARFREMSGLAGGGVRFIRPGAGSMATSRRRFKA
jgi:hypothetical protein